MGRSGDWQLVHYIECLPDALLVTDTDGCIQLANSRLSELFGYSRDELVGLSVETLLPETLRERHQALRRGYMASPEDRPMGSGVEVIARRKDGQEFRADIELRVRDTPRGRAILAVVRELERAERDDPPAELGRARARRLRELDQLVLSARVALDDWSELVFGIRAAALRLSGALPADCDARADAEEILRSLDSASHLFERLRGQVARQTASAAGIHLETPDA